MFVLKYISLYYLTVFIDMVYMDVKLAPENIINIHIGIFMIIHQLIVMQMNMDITDWILHITLLFNKPHGL